MSTVAEKLGITSGTVIGVDGHPLDEVAALLGDLPSDARVERRAGSSVDQLILAADGLEDLALMLDGAWTLIQPQGRLWVWYRKGANRARTQGSAVPLHRDTLQALLAEHGMDGVTLISVNDTWSAMRIKQL
jgi:hypothetical protein